VTYKRQMRGVYEGCKYLEVGGAKDLPMGSDGGHLRITKEG